MTPTLTAATRLFGILGNPVAHSRSPVIHNAAIAALGLDATYVALQCKTRDFPGLFRGLALAGGGGNVTIPHKGAAAEAVDRASPRVKATRACNTFWSKRGKLYGENTDVIGFNSAIRQVVDDVRGTRVLVIGAGGGARAVIYGLLEEGAAGITVLGRSRKRAREIAEVAGRRKNRVAYITTERLLKDEGFDLIVNATPLGLRATDRFPIRFGRVAALTAVLDIVYQPGGTAWVNHARELGIPAADGSEMLLGQAAAAFELWFNTAAPLDVMRTALESA